MKNILFFILAVLLLSSCSYIQRKLYSPNQPNNPSIEKKNDYSLSLTYGGPSGFDLNAGYAVTNRIAVIGGVYTQRNDDIEESYSIFSTQRDSSLLTFRHNGYHAGAGVYVPLEGSNSQWYISFFTGYTKGSFRMNEKLYHLQPPPSSFQANLYNSKITRWFGQAAVNFYEEQVHGSLIARLNFVGYDLVNTDYSAYEQDIYNLPPNGHPKWSQFVDLSFDTKFFFTKDRSIGAQLFGTLNTRLNRKDFNFAYYPFRIGIGLVIKPSFKIKEKKD